MEDYSHLRGAEGGEHETKGLVNESGHHHQTKSGKDLLERMKYISSLISAVSPNSYAKDLNIYYIGSLNFP
jgi:hypothetical protein